MKWGLLVSPYLGCSPDIIQALHGARAFPLNHGKKRQRYAALINVPQAGDFRHIVFQLKHETGNSGLEEPNADISPITSSLGNVKI